ncbi:AGAP004202-PA-like protein [Anopheles sinensis]|uniref:AGAP004202-PA-like protein n=1 Tax=Anopheles sinensis TaxID=74873 RepID=A0A084VNR3_ANOSI|nr:AGAP004202-PA-like protein [Anopheles sinensis]
MASGSADQLVQLLGETIECPICLSSVDDPRLCPACSKLFCHGCIRQWLQKEECENGSSKCPNCKCNRTLEEFVSFRSGSAIDALKSIVDSKNDPSISSMSEGQTVCPERVQQGLRKLLLETEAVFIETEQRITQELDKQRALLKQSKDNLIKTINIMVQQEFREIHKQFHDKMEEANAWSDILTKNLDKHQIKLETAKYMVENEPSENLLHKRPELEQTCAKLVEDLKVISPNVKPYQFNSQLIPEPSTWKFSVRKYSAARSSNEVQYSDLVTDDIGSVWRLEVHPNGYDDAKNTSLSIFLQLYSGIEGQYHYSVELLGANRSHVYEDETYFELRKGWGQNHFIDLKALQDSYLLEDGLELRFSVRALNLIDKYEKMKKRASLLSAEVDLLKKETKPDCLNHVFTVRNVVEAAKNFGCLYSDVLADDLGGSWRLQIFPGGNGECKGNFLSIFLELHNGIPNKYEFTVALLHRSEKKVVKKTLEYCFQPALPFGWKTFLGREEFINNGYIQKDSLSIRLTITPPSALQKFNYLRQYHERALAAMPLARPESSVVEEPKPSSSHEPLEARLRKTSISFVKNLFTKSSSTEQPQ